VIVVKIGGGGGVDVEACCADVARLHAGGERVALVHGGSAAATRLGEALGHAPRFLTAPSGVRSRYTDARTLEIFTLALGGINAEIVARLQARGVDALGLSGIDGRVLEGRRKEAVVAVEDGRRRVIRDDRSGTVERVNAPLLRTLLESGYMPVLSPPALSPDGPINVDADRASALVASALGAHTLIVLTNVPGLLRDPADPTTLVHHVHGDAELEAALVLAASRMRIKLLAARTALNGGVARVVIADGCRDRPVARALDGEGTIVDSRQNAVGSRQKDRDI
jgi:acetylglutamate/LysW-gamma-L-alpha-aminoadipate kinase